MVSKKIKALRKHYNYKQDDLAIACDVTRSAISNWEANRRDPNPESLRKLASLFDVSMEQLLDDDITIEELLRKENNVVNSFYNDQVVNEHKKTHNFVHKFNMVLTLIVTICLLIVLIPAIKENDIFKNEKTFYLSNVNTISLQLSNSRESYEYEMILVSETNNEANDKKYHLQVDTTGLFLENGIYYSAMPLVIKIMVNNIHFAHHILLLKESGNLIYYSKYNKPVIDVADEVIFIVHIIDNKCYLGAFLDE